MSDLDRPCTVGRVPFTFLAHQGPILPIARRWPGYMDGPALVVGSMSPDFAYVLAGSRFELWAHALPWLVIFCIPVTIIVAWLIVRVLAAVVAVHLPDAGHFRLRDFSGLATHRFQGIPTVAGAVLGAVSHVVLDSFTHDWGWFARNLSWYRHTILDATWLGRDWTVYRFVQYAGHIAVSLLCLWLLWSYGRQGWMKNRARSVDSISATLGTHLVLWGCSCAGALSGLIWVTSASAGAASDILRVAGAIFVGMTLGAFALRLSGLRNASATRSA